MPIDLRSSSSLPQSHATISWFLLISVNVLWATGYAAGKLALQSTLIILMLTLHMGISALIPLPSLLIIKRGELKLSRKDLPQRVLLLSGTFLVIVLLHDLLTSVTIIGGCLTIISVSIIFQDSKSI